MQERTAPNDVMGAYYSIRLRHPLSCDGLPLPKDSPKGRLAAGASREIALDLLPRFAKTDGADSLPGCFADEWHADRTRPFAVGGMSVALDHGRVDQIEIAFRARRSIVIDQMKRPPKKRFDMFGRIADGGGRTDELGLAPMHLADAQQAPQNIGHMGTERSSIGVDFVDDDVFQPGEKGSPSTIVVRQDARMEHVGIGNHEISLRLNPVSLFSGGVAIEGADPNRCAACREQFS